jgi:uncharacterized membrane protein
MWIDRAIGGRSKVLYSYERIGLYCLGCGCLGHEVKQCEFNQEDEFEDRVANRIPLLVESPRSKDQAARKKFSGDQIQEKNVIGNGRGAHNKGGAQDCKGLTAIIIGKPQSLTPAACRVEENEVDKGQVTIQRSKVDEIRGTGSPFFFTALQKLVSITNPITTDKNQSIPSTQMRPITTNTSTKAQPTITQISLNNQTVPLPIDFMTEGKQAFYQTSGMYSHINFDHAMTHTTNSQIRPKLQQYTVEYPSETESDNSSEEINHLLLIDTNKQDGPQSLKTAETEAIARSFSMLLKRKGGETADLKPSPLKIQRSEKGKGITVSEQSEYKISQSEVNSENGEKRRNSNRRKWKIEARSKSNRMGCENKNEAPAGPKQPHGQC